MKLLLDTHYVLALLRRELVDKHPELLDALEESNQVAASVVSLWEIAIKSRLSKLALGLPLEEIADFLETAGVSILPLDRHHAVASVDPEPPTRDPFDRMLLAQCRIEGMRLVTFDRALAGHPLAWRPAVR